MNALKISRKALLLGSSIASLALCAALTTASSLPKSFMILHAATPAGYDVLTLSPTGAQVSVLGLIECPELEGAQHISEGINGAVVSADGKRLNHFPSNFSFRVTASLRRTVISGPSGEIATAESPQDFLLKLRFRLKAFDGLKVTEIEPDSVQMIGVPADVPYDERIYRISFNIDRIPVSDRCVLEVLTPEGKRVTRFHFDLL